MFNRANLLLIISFFTYLFILCTIVSCSTATTKFKAKIDFNPTYEWRSLIPVYVNTFHDSANAPFEYSIELKLARLVFLASKRLGIKAVEEPESAEIIALIKYSASKIQYTIPSQTYSFGTRQTEVSNRSINQVFFNWSVISPPLYEEDMFVHIEIWFYDKSFIFKFKEGIDLTRMVAYSSALLRGRDHNIVVFKLLVACLESIPGVNPNFEASIPKISNSLEYSWLSGVKTRGIDNAGYYTTPNPPFLWDDLIFRINENRIYDYFDYKAAMLMLLDNEYKCKVYFNRNGKIIASDCEIKRGE